MNWTKLFEMQSKLDEYITRNHQLEDADLFNEKFLALLVELGELANETRCFKFWSTQESSERAVILEEYVDNIHFLLSLGIEKGYEFSEVSPENVKTNKTNQFNNVFRFAIHFYENQTEEKYLKMIQAYLQLASLLGFTEKDILQAYIEKNEVNYKRQKSGY